MLKSQNDHIHACVDLGDVDSSSVCSVSDLSIHGISYLDSAAEGFLKNLEHSQAEYAAEEFLKKHLEFADNESLFKMFFAIKKELLKRNSFEEKTEKEY